jgi:heme-degrading monooxygenase HmoA
MYARVTQFDIDAVRIGLNEALQRFKLAVLPVLQDQPGYRGLYVLQTPEGRGMLISLWESRESEQAGLRGGYYDEQVHKFLTLYQQPPTREEFQVTYAEMRPAAAPAVPA